MRSLYRPQLVDCAGVALAVGFERKTAGAEVRVIAGAVTVRRTADVAAGAVPQEVGADRAVEVVVHKTIISSMVPSRPLLCRGKRDDPRYAFCSGPCERSGCCDPRTPDDLRRSTCSLSFCIFASLP